MIENAWELVGFVNQSGAVLQTTSYRIPPCLIFVARAYWFTRFDLCVLLIRITVEWVWEILKVYCLLSKFITQCSAWEIAVYSIGSQFHCKLLIVALGLAILAFSSEHWLLKLLINSRAACQMVSWSGCFLCYDPWKMNQLDDITHLVNIVGFLHFVVFYCAQYLVQEITHSDFRSEHVDAKTHKQDWGDSMWTALTKKNFEMNHGN